MVGHRYLSGNALVCGDCLEVMSDLPDECVDLIYLDPPFNSNAFYVAAFDKGLVNQQLRDVWRWNEATERNFQRLTGNSRLRECVQAIQLLTGRRSSMAAYILYMGERLLEMRRILRPAGSIYLHCDPHANSYLRALMDVVFGADNLRNEIVWHYRSGALTSAESVYPRKHDTLFFYTKGRKWTFNTPREAEISDQMRARWGKYLEKDGRTVLYGSIKHEKAEAAKSRKRIMQRTGREPVDTDLAFVVNPSLIRSVWTDIPEVRNNPRYAESTGYPTQKPRALLERILQASSNPGDLVLDPFCGCGTSADAAASLGRGYLGIDISGIAVRVMEQRLTSRGHTVAPDVYGLGWDDITWAAFQERAFRAPEESEDGQPGWAWAEDRVAAMLKAVPNERKTGDEGVDARYYGVQDLEADERGIVIPIQVKTWRSDRRVGRPEGQSLYAAQMDMQREGKHAPMSMLVSAYPPAQSLRTYAASQGEVAIRTREEGLRAYPAMQAISVQEMLEKDARPLLPPPDPGYLVGDTQTQMQMLAGEEP